MVISYTYKGEYSHHIPVPHLVSDTSDSALMLTMCALQMFVLLLLLLSNIKSVLPSTLDILAQTEWTDR